MSAPHPKQQDRSRAAVDSLSASNSELEPDDRQDKTSGSDDRQGGCGREVGGRAALLAGGVQRGERDVLREDSDELTGQAGAAMAPAAHVKAHGAA